MDSTYIYALACPLTNGIRYIGKADNPQKRFKKHLIPSNLRVKTHKTDWIKSLLGRNLSPNLIVIAKVSRSRWKKMEILFIAKAKRLGWKLTNATFGGDGSLGCKHTDEAKRKMSIFHKGKVLSEGHKRKMAEARTGSRNGMYGKRHSFETLEKMSNALRKENPSNGALKMRRYRKQKREHLTG